MEWRLKSWVAITEWWFELGFISHLWLSSRTAESHTIRNRCLQIQMDWIEQCFTSPPKQYRLYGRRFLQVKRPNQQYQSTEGTNSTQTNQTYNKPTWTQNTASHLVYNNMGWLKDSSHRGQGCHAQTAVGLPPRYPQMHANKDGDNNNNHIMHNNNLQRAFLQPALIHYLYSKLNWR